MARFHGTAGMALASLAVSSVLAAPASAATYVVTNTADTGAGSLRAAIASANGVPGADTITFNLAGCPCVVVLATTLAITDAVTITGPGMTQLAISGNFAVQPFTTTNVPVTVTDLTIRDGRSTGNGGGINAGGPLSLARVGIRANAATNYGGGVLATGRLTLVDSVVEANTASQYDGGGVYANGGATISGSVFRFNETTKPKGYGGGGGLMVFGPGVSITTTVFDSNTSSDWGGGAYIADFAAGSNSTLSDVQFVNNYAGNGGGGGLFMWFGSALTNVVATGNYASGSGGGIYAGYAGNYSIVATGGQWQGNSATGGGGFYSDGDIQITGTQINGNVARNGNGGGVWTATNAVISGVTVTNNVSVTGGNSGGIDTGQSLTLSNSTIAGNQALAGSGGGTGSGGNATVTNVQYTNNFASGLGGGLLIYGGATITGSTFTGNVAATNWGGGAFADQTSTVTNTVFLQNTSAYAGGGLGVQHGSLTITGGRFEANNATTAGWGGGIYCGGPATTVTGTQFIGNTGSGPGGGIAANALTISGATFHANSAGGNGGAATAFGALDVSSSFLLANTAGGDGGGLWTNAALTLTRSRLVANTGAHGGGAFVGGGGTVTNTLFARNHATSLQGEAMVLASAGSTNVRHTTIGNGLATAAGSAIYVDGGSVGLQNNIVAGHAQGIVRNAGSVTAYYTFFSGNGVNVQGAGITNSHPFGGNPAFADPASDDYHLGVGSAAIDGAPSAGVAVDFDGNARPAGGGFDFGYAESTAVPVTAPRTFVASTGNDASPLCTLAAPCGSLQMALAHAQPGGEVVVLDSTGLAPATITRAVSIIATPGAYAGLSAPPGQNALTISAGATDKVFLRGLSVTSEGGDNGIVLYGGGALFLEDMTVRGYRQPGQANIAFTPAGSATLSLKDSRVQAGATGLSIANAAGSIAADIDNTRFESNGTGIATAASGILALRNSIVVDGAGDGINLAAANAQPLTAAIDRTLVSGNGGHGIASTGTLPVSLTVKRTTVRRNGGTGVYAAGGGSPSITRLDRTTITRNATGVGAAPGGFVQSRGNNTIEGNTVNGTPTSTYGGK